MNVFLVRADLFLRSIVSMLVRVLLTVDISA